MEAIEKREWTFHDRNGWGTGPWDNEPDKIQWMDEATGLPCLIVRNELGALCGYVGVDKGHPLYGKGYHECCKQVKCLPEEFSNADNPLNLNHETFEFLKKTRERDPYYPCDHKPSLLLDVHGGITFSNACADKDPEHGICHITKDQNEKAWWFGFDTAHAWDLIPGMFHRLGRPCFSSEDVYRDVPYVQEQVKSLAKQLKEIKVVL